MYKNVLFKYGTPCFAFFATLGQSTGLKAQLGFSGQLRPRLEWRDGFGTLKTSDNRPSAFVSQRTRVSLSYRFSKIIFQASVQDVRLWGQDASTISSTDGNKLGLHEAWAELVLANKKDTSFKKSPVDYFGIRVGRQELLYDDSRLLGNLDWLQQARRHDALVLKLLNHGWQVDAGFAFNQNSDAINYNGTYYTPANVPATVKDNKGNLTNTPAGMIPLVNATGLSSKSGAPAFSNPPGTNGLTQNYKALEYLYAAKKLGQIKLSGLFLADQFAKYKLDSVKNTAGHDVGYVYGRVFNQRGVNSRFTSGILVAAPFFENKLTLNGGFYYQSGHDKDGLDLAAYTSTVTLTWQQSKTSFTAGWELLSGNNAASTSKTNHRFDPLYGTPHKFWGNMDYFYAGSGSPSGGLNDAYFKIKYTVRGLNSNIDYHYFALANRQNDLTGAAIKKHLGSEIDLINTLSVNKFSSLELGLAAMFATNGMYYAKNVPVGSAKLNNYWAYLQINVKPDFLITK